MTKIAKLPPWPTKAESGDARWAGATHAPLYQGQRAPVDYIMASEAPTHASHQGIPTAESHK